LYLKIDDPKKRTGHCTSSRKQFDFYLDPQVNMGLFQQVYKQLNLLDLDSDGPLISFLRSMREEVKLIIQPLQDLFDSDHPSANRFFVNLPKIITKIAFDNHPNLMRGYLPFLQLLNKWQKEDPAILQFISWNIHTLNDQHIENFNAIIKSRTSNNQHLTLSILTREVACAGYRKKVEEELETGGKGKNQLRTEFEGKFPKSEEPNLRESLQDLLQLYRAVDQNIDHLGPIFPDKFAIGSEKIKHQVANMNFGETYWRKELSNVIPEMEEYIESGMMGAWNTILEAENAKIEELEKLGAEMEDEEEEKIEIPKEPFVRLIAKKKGVLYMDFIVFLYQRGYVENVVGSFEACMDNYHIVLKKKNGASKKRRSRTTPSSKEDDNEPTRKKKRA